MLDIRSLMTGLAEIRKVFHSEADFQHALAWHIHQTMPKSQIRLEFPVPVEHRKMYVDLYLPGLKTAIELKYVTRSVELKHNGESFALLNHGAHPPRRYDFLRDIQRLERMCSELKLCEAGHAVLLTNDPLYWKPPGRQGTVDAAFRVHEGQEIQGKREWTDEVSPGTKKGREKPIQLKGPYCLRWQDYSDFSEKARGRFRYLAVSVYR